ncbi:MAG: DUF721 domain-containing protein [Desulfovibrio sp.]
MNFDDEIKIRSMYAKKLTTAKKSAFNFLRSMDKDGNMELIRLWKNWKKILPAEISRMVRPLGRRGRKLILYTEDPAVSMNAQFMGPLILKKVNQFLGKEVFDKVSFELLNGRVPLDEQKNLRRSNYGREAKRR